MDVVFRIFMFFLPYALCIAAYIWVGKKAWRLQNAVAKTFALVFVGVGAAYTIYQLIRSIGGIMTNDNFEYIIIIVTVAVLFFASIAMALGQPEEAPAKKPNSDTNHL